MVEQETRSHAAFQVFQRIPKGPFWVRFTLHKKQYRIALNTYDERHANREALRIYSENSVNGPVITPSRLVEEFTEQFKNSPIDKHKKALAISERYLKEFFKTHNLTERDVEKYQVWRSAYWLTGPGKDIKKITYVRNGMTISRPPKRAEPSTSRLGTEVVVMRAFLKFARGKGVIKDIFSVPITQRKTNPRPTFSREEFERLIKLSQIRIEEPHLHTSILTDRVLLHSYMIILAYSGMRPAELNNLTWDDVLDYRASKNKPIGERDISLRVHGKSKSRTFKPHKYIIPSFDQVWDIFLRAHNGAEPTIDLVFTQDFKRGFKTLLKKAGLEKDYRGSNIVMYSFRHFYITRQLANNVDIHKLALQCGTSIKMIEQHYSKVSILTNPDELRPKWLK